MFENSVNASHKNVKKRNPMQPQPEYDKRNGFYPCGDNYGTGVKAKLGKIRASSTYGNVPQKSIRKPPESLA